jgi:hypothetical protein
MKLFTQPIDADMLKEFGVPLDSADAYYVYIEGIAEPKLYLIDDEMYTRKVYLNELVHSHSRLVPAWSLGQLIRIIKECGIGDWPKQDIMNTILKEDSRMMVPVAVMGITQLRAKNLIDFSKFKMED